MKPQSTEKVTAIRPTERTLYYRRSLLLQVWRFLAINWRMTKMILKSHDHVIK